jgi:hypothetical protein
MSRHLRFFRVSTAEHSLCVDAQLARSSPREIKQRAEEVDGACVQWNCACPMRDSRLNSAGASGFLCSSFLPSFPSLRCSSKGLAFAHKMYAWQIYRALTRRSINR